MFRPDIIVSFDPRKLMKEAMMKPDFEVRLDGMKALVNALGPVEAERFIMLPNLEMPDNAEWRKQQWLDETVASLAEKARALRQVNHDH